MVITIMLYFCANYLKKWLINIQLITKLNSNLVESYLFQIQKIKT